MKKTNAAAVSAPKTATPKTEAPAVTPPARLGKAGIAVLTAISKAPLTRAEISLATGIKSGFCSLLGHVDATKTEPSSLSYKGYLTVGVTEGKSASTYAITDKGREALKAATSAPVNPVPEAKPEAKPAAAKKPAASKKPAAKK